MDCAEGGFMEIATDHDPKHSAICMIEFAKGAMAHSKTVLMPNSDQSVTVSSWAYLLGRGNPSYVHVPACV